MKILKMIPFYLLSALYAFAVLVIVVTHPGDMMSDDMYWGQEAGGWVYANRLNYTIMALVILLIIIVPSVYAWKKRKQYLARAYIVLLVPLLVYLARYIYFINFFNI